MFKVAIIISAIVLVMWELANTALRVKAGFKWSPVLYEFIYKCTHTQKQVMVRAMNQIIDPNKYNRYICKLSPLVASYDLDLDLYQCMKDVVNKM